MQKIALHFWFDTQAKAAAEVYTKLFANSRIISVNSISDTPSGTVEIVSLQMAGQDCMFMSAGPLFKINPSISLMVVCENEAEVDTYWAELSKDGKVLMELSEYPFAKKYGWVQDRFGVSWQIGYMEGSEVTQKIMPALMYTGAVAGKAEEAMQFYTSLFKDGVIDFTARYEAGESPVDKPGTIKHAVFKLAGQKFVAMDSAHDHKFGFNEAVSLMVYCETQAEIDFLWEKLSAVPESEQCGWLKDKYGVSWQIVPVQMNEMMGKGTPEQQQRVTAAFMQMKKFDIATLQKAFDGE